MLMQLTEQDCSHQPAFVYVENKCTVKSFKLFFKMFNMFFDVFDIYYILYFNIQVKYLKIYH